MAKIIAITNQKGGVGKTTTAMNFGVGLVRRGKRVLFVDMDPQCSLTYVMCGNSQGVTVRDLLTNRTDGVAEAIQRVREGDLIAAHPDLTSIESDLEGEYATYRLARAIAPINHRYDYIIIDSPPALSMLTLNILTAASGVIVPSLADIFSLQGLGQLYSSIQVVRECCDIPLPIYGILMIRHTDRFILNRSMREMLENTAAQLGTRVFRSTIRDAIAVREAAASRQSLFAYSPRSKQTRDYEVFVEEYCDLERRGVWRFGIRG